MHFTHKLACGHALALPKVYELRVRPQRRLICVAALSQKPGSQVSWTQSVDEVDILVTVPETVRGHDIEWEVHPKRLRLKAAGDVLLEGDFGSEKVDLDGCCWVLEDAPAGRVIHITLAKDVSGYQSWTALLEADAPASPDLTLTRHVFLEFSTDDRTLGRVLLGLYGRHVPRTVANFAALCTGEKGMGQAGKPLHYLDCPVHRIIPGFMAQAGDFTKGDGTGGESIYGARFADEALNIPHDRAGLLSMANAGPDTNGSQFFVTFAPAPHLDGRHVVFGRVEVGMPVMRRLEELGTRQGKPSQSVRITACGLSSPEEFKRWSRQHMRQQVELEADADAAAAMEATELAKASLSAQYAQAGAQPWSPDDDIYHASAAAFSGQGDQAGLDSGPPVMDSTGTVTGGDPTPQERSTASDLQEDYPQRRRRPPESEGDPPGRGARLQSSVRKHRRNNRGQSQ